MRLSRDRFLFTYGGIGNQFFQLLVASYLNSIGCKTFVDSVSLQSGGVTKRVFELKEVFGTQLNESLYKKAPLGMRLLVKLRLNKILDKVCEEIVSEVAAITKNPQPRSSVYQGLFHDLDAEIVTHLEVIKNELWSNLHNMFGIESCVNEYYSKNVLAVHIRAGDYKNFKHVFNSLPDSYFVNGMQYFKKLQRDLDVVVFSDDDEVAERFADENGIKNGNRECWSALEVFYAFSCARFAVCSNSTFSLTSRLISAHPMNNTIIPKAWYSDKTRINNFENLGFHVT